MKKKHLLQFSLILFLCFISVYSHGDDKGTVRACLKNWGEHPFNSKHPMFRSYNTKVRVFGVGGDVNDRVHTDKPDLVLIRPNVSVMTKSTMNLLNPNGWYCLRGKVNVMSSTTINLHCRAHLASSKPGLTILGGNSDAMEKEITVLGGTRVKRVGCDGKNKNSNIAHSTRKNNSSQHRAPVGDKAVLSAQLKLIELGYAPGKADGIAGTRTIKTIREFQKDTGLPVTGELDRSTINSLTDATNTKKQNTLNNSESKSDLTTRLRELDKLRKDGIVTDEEFELLKKNAISTYQ